MEKCKHCHFWIVNRAAPTHGECHIEPCKHYTVVEQVPAAAAIQLQGGTQRVQASLKCFGVWPTLHGESVGCGSFKPRVTEADDDADNPGN